MNAPIGERFFFDLTGDLNCDLYGAAFSDGQTSTFQLSLSGDLDLDLEDGRDEEDGEGEEEEEEEKGTDTLDDES